MRCPPSQDLERKEVQTDRKVESAVATANQAKSQLGDLESQLAQLTFDLDARTNELQAKSGVALCSQAQCL